jgi:TolB protein
MKCFVPKERFNLLFISLAIFFASLHTLALDKTNALDKKQVSYKIAYNVLTDQATGNYEIFVMDLDGKNKQNISQNNGLDWVYYAFGDKLYFLSDRGQAHRELYLYSMKTNGKEVKKISKTRLKDSWFGSRNQASEFIVNPHGSEKPTFYIISSQGKHVKTVHPRMKFASDPIFTSDGKNIIFRGANVASKKQQGFIDELYICDLDGKILKQLTHYPNSDKSAKWYDYKAGAPNLNSLHKFVSYQSFQNGKYSLFATNLEGKKQWKLTSLQQNEGWHSWSPDYKWLAVELFDLTQTQFNIGLFNWQTKELQILTHDQFKYQQAPVFVEAH